MLADRAKQMVLLKKILPWQHGRTTDGLTREDFLSQVFLTLSHLIDIRKEGFPKPRFVTSHIWLSSVIQNSIPSRQCGCLFIVFPAAVWMNFRIYLTVMRSPLSWTISDAPAVPSMSFSAESCSLNRNRQLRRYLLPIPASCLQLLLLEKQ